MYYSFAFKELHGKLETEFNGTYAVYQDAWKQWCEFLTPDQQDNIESGGFYSASPAPGLRILVINSMLGHNKNW